jgi:hypothetical protein
MVPTHSLAAANCNDSDNPPDFRFLVPHVGNQLSDEICGGFCLDSLHCSALVVACAVEPHNLTCDGIPNHTVFSYNIFLFFTMRVFLRSKEPTFFRNSPCVTASTATQSLSTADWLPKGLGFHARDPLLRFLLFQPTTGRELP